MASVTVELSPSEKKETSRLSFFTVFSANIFLRSFIFTGIIYFSVVLGGWPGQSVLPVLLVSFIVGLCSAFVYGKIAEHSFAEKGLYFYLKNRLGQTSAFITTFILLVSGNILIGYMISFLPKFIISQLTYIAGIGYNINWLSDASFLMRDPQAVGIFGIVMVIAAYVSTTFSKSIFPKIFVLSVVLLLFVGVIIFIQLGLPFSHELAVTWDAFYDDIAYAEMVNQAREAGMNNYIFGGMYSFAAIGVVLWFFMIGHETINLNGYYKKRNSVLVNLISVVVTFVFLFGFYLLILDKVGFSWIRAQAYISLISQGDFPGWITTYAGLLGPYPAFFIFIILSLILTTIVILGTAYISSTIFIKSWAEDGIIPDVFLLKNRSNGKYGIAYIIISLLFGIGVGLSAFSQTIFDVTGFIVILQLFQIPIFLAVMFSRKTKQKGTKNGREELITIVLAAMITLFLVLSLLLLLITPIPSEINFWLGISIGGVSGILAMIYYFLQKKRPKKLNENDTFPNLT